METNVMKDAKKQFSRIGLVLFLGTLLIYGVDILIEIIITNVPAIAENRNLSFLISMLSMYVFAYPVIFLMFRKIPVQISDEKKKMQPRHLPVAFLMCYAGTYICNYIANYITTYIGIIKQSPVDNIVIDALSGINPAVNLFIVVICGPIMEELLFRKTIIDRTAGCGEGVSIVFSGLMFGLFHGNLVQFSYAFLLGVFFGFIYIKTKNIIYPIILHMAINLISTIASFILEASGYMDIMEAITSGATESELLAAMSNIGGLGILFLYSMCLLGFVIAGIVIFCKSIKKFSLNPGEITIEKGHRIKTVILNPGVILYSVFYIVMIILQLAL